MARKTKYKQNFFLSQSFYLSCLVCLIFSKTLLPFSFPSFSIFFILSHTISFFPSSFQAQFFLSFSPSHYFFLSLPLLYFYLFFSFFHELFPLVQRRHFFKIQTRSKKSPIFRFFISIGKY
jgi:hypothetical protein